MTNTARHTPALWALYSPHPSEQYVDQINTDGQHRRSIFRIHHDDDIVRPEAGANAYLIAAAPDMFEALEFVRMTFADIQASKRKGYYTEYSSIVAAAIAKAKVGVQ
jgi:hypothetical protein